MNQIKYINFEANKLFLNDLEILQPNYLCKFRDRNYSFVL